MQEVKFRVWDKWNKQYFENLNNIFITGNGEIGIVDKYGHNLIDEYQERFVSEFSTGIKDKNGVEIHVGDIVAEIPQFDDDEPDLYEVVYNEDGHYPAFDFKGWAGEANGISELSLTCGIEVIGNINENKDLLEEK